MDQLLIGASWYPEMWPADQWAADVDKMSELGFGIVRAFEFAWHRLEPAPGRYDFDWAIRVMDLCHARGIAVMVGTPTAAPPAWLTTRHPEVLRTDADGRVATHGQRKHYSQHSPTYTRLAAGIAAEMARRFAGHPALHSWQIDNEMSGFDFSESTRAAFHEFLRRRFGPIDALNNAWGLEFWSQWYDDYSQIPLPTASVGSVEIPERHHPSLILAAAEFQNAAWTRFISAQIDAIRDETRRQRAPEVPITSNMTPGMAMNWYAHNKLLDRVGHSLYRDVVHYPWNGMFYDRMRAEKPGKPFWLLETAPSWSAGGRMWNIHHDAAGVQAMSWMATMLGSSMTVFWQWREHWAGQEMQHGTLVTATGKWRPNKDAMTQLCRDAATHGPWLAENPPVPAQVAVFQSNEAAWAFSIDPIDVEMKYEERWRDDVYLPLTRRHIWRDVIDPTADLSRYRVLILASMPVVPDDTRRRLADWVRQGGRLLLGPLTGYRTADFTAFRDREFGGLEDLIGGESSTRFTVHWVEDRVAVEFAPGVSCRTKNWCEGFAATTGKPIAYYRGGYGDGHAAVIDNVVGRGRVITTGCRLDEPTYLRLVETLMADAGVSRIAEGDGDVVVVPRGTPGRVAGYGIVNLAEADRRVTVAGREIRLAPLQWRIEKL